MKKAWAVMALAGRQAVGMLLMIYLMGGFVQDPSGFGRRPQGAIHQRHREDEGTPGRWA